MKTEVEKLKYVRITEFLREQIQSGRLKVDDRLPSFGEMREQYGATPTTVARVYSLLEQDGLVKREKGRGIFVAQPSVRTSTGVIGVYGANFEKAEPYAMRLLEGIQHVARRADLELLLLNLGSEVKWEKVDGVLDCNTGEYLDSGTGAKLPMRKVPYGIPYVAAISPLKGMINVVTNDREATFEATSHLISLGIAEWLTWAPWVRRLRSVV